jgi:hypothetical protein
MWMGDQLSLKNRQVVSRDNWVGIATGWAGGIGFLEGSKGFSVLHSVQTGPGVHPASYAVCTGDF